MYFFFKFSYTHTHTSSLYCIKIKIGRKSCNNSSCPICVLCKAVWGGNSSRFVFSFSDSKLSLCSSSSRYFHKHQQPPLVHLFTIVIVWRPLCILRNIWQRGLDRIKANCPVFVFVAVLLLRVEGPWSNCWSFWHLDIWWGFTLKLCS